VLGLQHCLAARLDMCVLSQRHFEARKDTSLYIACCHACLRSLPLCWSAVCACCLLHDQGLGCISV